MNQNKKMKAFTLAEVLITLTVIGIIAAITVPVMFHNTVTRTDSYRHANIVSKVTKAMDMMRANGELIQFNSTDEFVNVLQKYLKINKRCDSDHLAECWPTEKVTAADGREVNISSIKTRRNFGFKDDDASNNKNVGLILTDGAHIILTYDTTIEEPPSISDGIKAVSKYLPVGNGYEELLNFTTDSAGAVSFIMDVNGAKGPNKETSGQNYHDIRHFFLTGHILHHSNHAFWHC